MIARELITATIVPLKTSDTGLEALNWMDEYRVSHMPIVNNSDFLGLISEEDIYALNSYEEPVGSHHLSLTKPYLDESQHIFDVFRIMSELQLTLVPVLDDKNHYLGVITTEELLKKFASISSLRNPGGVIVLERNTNDYSLTEIAQIVESNDAKVLGIFITSNPDSTRMEISIKVNRLDLGPILQTFNRYNYIIKASYGEDTYYDILKDRYDLLMTYLNI
ncbi:MAG: CBS domain-containing protein [Bacteroidales bacterium]|nr:CBS domain-containing protein [Bacteroidales bacterium]MDZ4204580.1 CBS domain-containing protein [Bacteroidales bacterium]